LQQRVERAAGELAALVSAAPESVAEPEFASIPFEQLLSGGV
jgi:FMN reductase